MMYSWYNVKIFLCQLRQRTCQRNNFLQLCWLASKHIGQVTGKSVGWGTGVHVGHRRHGNVGQNTGKNVDRVTGEHVEWSQVNMLAESLVNMLTESLVNMLAKSMTRRTHDQANLFPSDLTKRWPWWSCHWEQVDLAMGEYVDYVTAEQVGLAIREEVDLIFVCSWKFTRKKFVLFSFLNK